MKKKIILFPLFGLLLYFGLQSYSAGPAATASLELTGVTGTVGCGMPGCHTPTATSSTTVSIQLLSSGSPVTSYTAGSSYVIQITGTQTSGSFTLPKFGFQATCVRTGTSANAGAMVPIALTHSITVSGVDIIEHLTPLSATTGSGGAGTTYVVNIPWTAPVAGTGSVTIHAVVNAVNADGAATSADKWNNATPLVISETVSTTVAPITGTMTVCVGAATTLSDATPGGTWSSGSTGIATVSATGLVTGVTAGLAVISYSTGGPSPATAVVTVNPSPAVITGTLNVCVGATRTLADATAGGTWSSTTTAIATIGTAGLATGVAPGTSIIKYTIAGGCFATATLTVNSSTAAAIAGPVAVCVGHTITLTDASPGGTWTSLHTGIATVGTSGIVTGVTAGADTIKYKVTSACGTDSVRYPITVRSLAVCAAGTVTLNEPAKPEINIYPNPNTGSFTINILSGANEQAHVIVTNLLGQKIKELNITTNSATDIQLNAPAGVYYITAQTAGARYEKKVVLE